MYLAAGSKVFKKSFGAWNFEKSDDGTRMGMVLLDADFCLCFKPK